VTTTYSLACVSGLLDIYKKQWYEKIIDLIKFDSGILPVLKESGDYVSELNSYVCTETGIPKESIVLSSCLDQAASAVGTGNFVPKIITENTGTVLALSTTVSENKAKSFKIKIPVFYHAVPEKYLLVAWHQNGGAILDWFKNAFKFSYTGINFSSKEIFKYMDKEAEGVLPGAEGLIFIPYISGAGFPYYRESANGLFFGIKACHSRAHFIRAILESLGYEISMILQIFRDNDIDWNKIYSAGGGANSRTWLQIKADITQKNISILKTKSDTGALGTNILAAKYLGYYKNLNEAFDNMNKIDFVVRPAKKFKKIYFDRISGYEFLKNIMLSNFK